MTYTYKFCADTHSWLFHSEYQFTELRIHSHMNAQTMSVYTISTSSEPISALQSFGMQWREQTASESCIMALPAKLEKVIVKCYEQWGCDIRIYCILNTENNVILLHWNKQHFESGIIQWGCRLLDENLHLVLMITCFAMQICHRVGCWAIWSMPWRKINQHLPSKQTSARGGKVYSYSGFLNFFSTCSSAFRRLTSSSWSMS